MLHPVTQTLYVEPDAVPHTLTNLVTRYGLRRDPKGSVEVLDAFWDLPRDVQHPDVAPALLVVADLEASLDPRNLSIAESIRDMVVARD